MTADRKQDMGVILADPAALLPGLRSRRPKMRRPGAVRKPPEQLSHRLFRERPVVLLPPRQARAEITQRPFRPGEPRFRPVNPLGSGSGRPCTFTTASTCTRNCVQLSVFFPVRISFPKESLPLPMSEQGNTTSSCFRTSCVRVLLGKQRSVKK